MAEQKTLTVKRRQIHQQSLDSLLNAGYAPAMARIFASRNVSSSSDLKYELSSLPSWESMKGLPEGARMIAKAVQERQKIVVLSDYDADGATGCAVMVRGLAEFGANVDFIVPLREEHGYGLTPDIVPQILASKPALVITVDNGISSVPGIKMLRQQGIQVVVTDHHLAPPELPEANVIINPNQPGCSFASKAISGAGVAFYTIIAVRAVLDQQRWFTGKKPNIASLLPIVALGTIADVVPLDITNRILVSQGLKRIREGVAQPGITAIAEMADRKVARLASSDFAFYLGPRLNAAGRLDDMRKGIRCLITDDEQEAIGIAAELEALNRSRRAMQASVQDQAIGTIDDPYRHRAIVVAGDWHCGVIGIVAGKIKELYRRPTIVFSEPDDQGLMKGSARSVAGYHIRDALLRIENAHPNLIAKYGGHAMAAGMTLEKSCFDRFQQAFVEDADRFVPAAALDNVIETDGELEPDGYRLETAELLEFCVWGQNFPEPVFDGQFTVRERRIVADKHLKLAISPTKAPSVVIPAIWFGAAGIALGNEARLAFKLGVNEYRGAKSVQAMISGAEGFANH